MESKELKNRTKQFALEIIDVVLSLPKNNIAEVLGKQLLRSATSVGANYRSACRSRSQAEFISKLAIVIEEADESQYWVELLAEKEIINRAIAAKLWKEADELVRIMTASSKTAKRNNNR